MKYEPIKESFRTIIRRHSFLRKVFYTLLGLFFLREWYVKRELRRSLKHHEGPLTLYDAGCGFGQYTYYLAQRFPNVTILGVDLNEEHIRECSAFFAREKLTNCRFAVEDLTSMPHVNEFDLILSVDVMEHIPNDRAVFNNFYKSLRRGGLLILTTPSTEGGSDAHDDDGEGFIAEHARTGYSVQEIREKLETAGFTVLSIQYTYGPWGMFAWRLSIKYPMVMLNVSKLFFLVLPLYYCVVLPFFFLGMVIDFYSKKETGAGLLVMGKKL